MSKNTSRADFFKSNPAAKAWSVLDDAANKQMGVTSGCPKLEEGCFKGKTAIIIGSGVSGLTTAYELLAKKTGMKVTILEAQNRTGGRCLTLRTGDTLVQDQDSELFHSKKGSTQVVRFDRPQGDNEPYLNAGPGRIPSGHKRLLQYLKTFGVDVEVYVMDSASNLVQTTEGYGGNPVVSRRLDHNTRGHVAEMVYKNADVLINGLNSDCSDEEKSSQVEKLKDLMVSFGDLSPNGDYNVGAAPDGQDENLKASDRAGFSVLPGVDSGVVAEMLNLNSLLDSEFWKVNFYQPQDFLWQPTLFQPVGGMDQVQHAFAQQVAALGGTIHLNSPVKKIDWDEENQQFEVHVAQLGSDQCEVLKADYCFSNVAIPFLEKMLSDRLQGAGANKGFDESFKSGLKAVYKAQNTPELKDGFPDRFLACTTKIGWQAERSLWQGGPVATCHDEHLKRPDSEKGVVPIFGGISRTDNEIVQIWYPSNDYHDQKGILTGCYNYSKNAYEMGNLPIDKRLERARDGAKLFGKEFGAGLENGVAIAWQHMPYIKGGWAQWHLVGENTAESVHHFNHLTQGTGVDGSKQPNFFIVGDQLSSLPGWQEGAIVAALNALSRAADCSLPIPHLASLPDTRVMVEGV
ncbi:flavin monoamine oxidase family protein [Litoribacillus peritrichatus]|uniref:Tryptophan 2-monooxygenase n=1 Tax=Litoribacillus peritrichatus TaxID=718191 RepID=A0ABP7MBV2_9GAMM